MEFEYLKEKKRLESLNLTYEEYEKAIRAWCELNGY